MKAILENYSSNLTTEPLYFSECLNRVGSQGMLWNPEEVSIYDAHDVMKPDVVVVTMGKLSLDIFKLLKSSSTKLVVNVAGSSEKEVDLLCEAIKTNKIDCPFIFSETSPNGTHNGIRRVNILKGADVFLQDQNNTIPDYLIDKAFVVDEDQEMIDFEGSYHVLSQYSEVKADIHFPIHSFYALCKNYKEIVIKHRDMVPTQLFFDAHFYGDNVSLDGPSISLNTKIGSGDKPRSMFGSNAKKEVKAKHLCTHRMARFLRSLGDTEEAKKVEDLVK
tara:strand:- start:20838 stop:21665 length:828 start_codon:yes stop_codon:yes gene_type:complete